MNGRIYDPLLGRFLSADIVVQNPASVQSYNRYSYVLNNPLSFTDPSGWFVAPPPVAPPAISTGTAGSNVGPYQNTPMPNSEQVRLQAVLMTNRNEAIQNSGLTRKEYEEYETLRRIVNPPAPDSEVNPTPEIREAPSREGLERLRERYRQLAHPTHDERADQNSIQSEPIVTVNQQQPTTEQSGEQNQNDQGSQADRNSGGDQKGEDKALNQGGDQKDAAAKAASGKLRPLDSRAVQATDMHAFKGSYVGPKDISKYDAKVDENGQVVLVTKDGKTKVETGLTVAQVKEDYPNKKKEDEERNRK